MLGFSDPLETNKNAQLHWSKPPTVLYNECSSDCVRPKWECIRQGGDLGEVQGTKQASGAREAMSQDRGSLPALDLSVEQTMSQIGGLKQEH